MMGSSTASRRAETSCFTKHATNEALRAHRESLARLLHPHDDVDRLQSPIWGPHTFYSDRDGWYPPMPKFIEETVVVAAQEPIPEVIKALGDYINCLPRKRNGLPSKNEMRKDVKLNGEASRKTGCLRVEKRGGRLRKWKGDERLFTKTMWDWLIDEAGNELPWSPQRKGKKRPMSALQSSHASQPLGDDAGLVIKPSRQRRLEEERDGEVVAPSPKRKQAAGAAGTTVSTHHQQASGDGEGSTSLEDMHRMFGLGLRKRSK